MVGTEETCRRVALLSREPVQAPASSPPHQRRPSAGAETRPTTGRPSSISPISVPHTGTPRTKLLVPSIGSITHWRGEAPVLPNSSPITWSRERARESWERTSCSAAVSASVTSVRSGLVETSRSCALNREAVSWSTASASTWARRRSSA